LVVARGRVVLATSAVLALAGFAVLVLYVTRDATAAPHVDQSWHDALRRLGIDHSAWLPTMRVITHFGDTATVLVVDVMLFIVCLYQRWRRLAIFVAMIGLGGWGLRILIRDLVGRPRPSDALWPADGSSFPSGHTTNATLMVALVVIVCWPLVRTGTRWAMVVGAVVYALAVGFSRSAGGVHWPSDVLAGWTLAAGYLCLVAVIFRWDRATPAAPPETPGAASTTHRD
jgi:undecaprenyl-diphosphatase